MRMENENWFGRDADEAVMAMDRRSLLEQIKSAISNFINKGKKNGQTDIEAETIIKNILDEPLL